MLGHHRKVLALMCVGLLLITTAPLTTAAAPPPKVGLGMNYQSAKALTEAGAPPAYSSFWVGPWTITSGWGALDTMLRASKAAGTTPVVYWYYWGDNISPSCVEEGCNGRSREQWSNATRTLADHVRAQMGGARTIIVVENEFNKGGIDSESYAPRFDSLLRAEMDVLKAVPGVEISIGFGSWNQQNWGRFPKSLEASHSIGFQMMRGSTRDTEANYRAAPDKVATMVSFINGMGKASLLYDLALSSYPNATWTAIQAETLKSILDRRDEYAAMGLEGIVYRELNDNPSMDPANYFGHAEKYWGLRDSAGNAKPAFEHWLAAYGRVLTAPEPNVPGAFEGESIPATTGRAENDSKASAGKVWNLWTNGELRKVIVGSAGDYRVSVVARGSAAGGVDARMEIRLNGQALRAASVPAGTLQTFSVDARLPEGTSVLAVAFTNDAVVNGQDRNLYVDLVRVERNSAPVASFDLMADDLTVTFDASNSTDPDGDALNYSWSFGDGTTGAGVRVTKKYAATGGYDVTLTVRDAAASANATRAIYVSEPVLTASFDVRGEDLTWTFDASNSSDSAGRTLGYSWDFGDGTSGSGVVATRTYEKAGNYSVTLVVTNGSRAAVAGRVVNALAPNVPPVANFNVTGLNMTWTFNASTSYDPDGGALEYAWDLGDGTTATGMTVTKTYASPGDYVVTLTVRDAKNASTLAYRATAVADNRAPVANFTASGGGQHFTFDASGSSDPEGKPLRYEWTFGDGSPMALGARVTKSYEKPGDYTVTLTVVDDLGVPVRISQVVKATPFFAQFSPHDGNNWWVQARVSGNEPIRSVCASVNGGQCRALTLQSWGSWAASFNVPTGSKLTFTATSVGGRQFSSVVYEWPSGTPYLTAIFKPYEGNNWWVQTKVDASQPLKGVCASVDGGSCRPLTLQSWGAWAASFHVPNGAKVTFTATSTSNQVVTSDSYKWPVY